MADRNGCSRANESGFTLVELLVVLVILPLVLGAAAEAVIISLRTNTATSQRLSDSDSAQTTAAYFNSDIQGASLITINQNSATFPTDANASATAPEYCPKAAPVTGATSLVQLYRSSPALSVGYWLQGSVSNSKVVRYSCTVSNFKTTQQSIVTVADVPVPPIGTSAVLTGSTTVTPSQFQSAASSGWTSTLATSTTTSTGQLNSLSSIGLESVSDFTLGPVVVETTLGPESATCSSVGSAALGGCTSSGTGYVSPFSSSVSQASVSGVQLSITEPGSSYSYQVLGSPRTGSGLPVTSSPTLTNIPTLLALGAAGLSFSGGGNSQCNGVKYDICATGTVYVDQGNVSCPSGNHNGIYTTSPPIYQAGGGSVSGNCSTTVAPQVSDPVAPTLPQPCFALTSGRNLPTNPPSPTSGAAAGKTVPGIYTNQLTGVLEPGVYVAEAGTGSISMSTDDGSSYWSQNQSGADDPGSGVLIYIPGPAGAYSSACSTYQPARGTPPSVGPTGNQSNPVVPLSAHQSQYWFNGSTSLGDMWLWQDVTNPTGPALGGNDVLVAAGGLMYMPGANLISTSGTPSITTGKLIVGGVSTSGGGNGVITLTGT